MCMWSAPRTNHLIVGLPDAGSDAARIRQLLMSLDRVQGNEIVATQEQIADMLGVRCGGASESALRLEGLGLVRYGRGRIIALDREGLERQACECYAVVKKEYDRLLHETIATPDLRRLCAGHGRRRGMAAKTARAAGQAAIGAAWLPPVWCIGGAMQLRTIRRLDTTAMAKRNPPLRNNFCRTSSQSTARGPQTT